MNIVEIIEKKSQNQKLTSQEIEFFVKGFQNGSIKDYQASALLVAICINGMSDQEIFALTQAMVESGIKLDLTSISGFKIDKHSTGGVGDKLSLIIGPILAALGYKFPKMAGRGLGFTGGTIDKLESITNFNTSITVDKFLAQVDKIGLAIISQSKHLVPADKKLYALRDVTGTVNSIGLIASSIMSKKIATGADLILIDVKFGDGAFMKKLSDAKLLAQKLVDIGNHFGKKTFVEITNMSLPLGKMIGNKNEVIEAQSILAGNQKDSLSKFAFSMVERLLINWGSHKESEAKRLIQQTIDSGTALEKFNQMITAQGGNPKEITSFKFWTPAHKYEVRAQQSGYVKWESALAFGKIAHHLGSGRTFKEDAIDQDAGVQLICENGDYVVEDQVLFVLYSSKKIAIEQLQSLIDEAYAIVDKPHKAKMFWGSYS